MQVCFSFQLFSLEKDIVFQSISSAVFNELDTDSYLEHIKMLCSMETLGEGNGTPLQYSCLESRMDGGAWWAAVHGVAKIRTRLRDFTFIFHFHALEKEMATHSSGFAH